MIAKVDILGISYSSGNHIYDPANANAEGSIPTQGPLNTALLMPELEHQKEDTEIPRGGGHSSVVEEQPCMQKTQVHSPPSPV